MACDAVERGRGGWFDLVAPPFPSLPSLIAWLVQSHFVVVWLGFYSGGKQNKEAIPWLWTGWRDGGRGRRDEIEDLSPIIWWGTAQWTFEI